MRQCEIIFKEKKMFNEFLKVSLQVIEITECVVIIKKYHNALVQFYRKWP